MICVFFLSGCFEVLSIIYLHTDNINAFKALFFLILGLQIFFQNIKVGGGKKIKIKIAKNIFIFFNLKHIWIGGKKNNKNCMILNCKNAEMAIFFFFFNKFGTFLHQRK